MRESVIHMINLLCTSIDRDMSQQLHLTYTARDWCSAKVESHAKSPACDRSVNIAAAVTERL